MNFSQMQVRLSYLLDDVNNGYFTLTQIKRCLNDAQMEVQKRLINAGAQWYTKCVSTNLIADTNCYTVPTDFLKLHRLEVITDETNNISYMVQQITMNQQDAFKQNWSTVSSGNPTVYFIKKNALTMYPVPNTVYPLKLNYSYLVADMVNDSDVPDCPTQYQELIIFLAAVECFIKDGRDASLLMGKIEAFDKMMKSDAEDRLQDQPRMVVMEDNDSGDYGNWY